MDSRLVNFFVDFDENSKINRNITTTTSATTSKPTSTTTTTESSYENNVESLTKLISRCIRSNNYWSCITDHSAKTPKSRKYVFVIFFPPGPHHFFYFLSKCWKVSKNF